MSNIISIESFKEKKATELAKPVKQSVRNSASTPSEDDGLLRLRQSLYKINSLMEELRRIVNDGKV